MTDSGERDGWSRGACEKALTQCAEDIGESPSRQQYRRWRDGSQPSAGAIARCFDGWNAAKEAVGLQTYASGQHPNYRHVGRPRSECSVPVTDDVGGGSA